MTHTKLNSTKHSGAVIEPRNGACLQVAQVHSRLLKNNDNFLTFQNGLIISITAGLSDGIN